MYVGNGVCCGKVMGERLCVCVLEVEGLHGHLQPLSF